MHIHCITKILSFDPFILLYYHIVDAQCASFSPISIPIFPSSQDRREQLNHLESYLARSLEFPMHRPVPCP